MVKDRERIDNAIADYLNGMSRSAAASKHGVAESTLGRNLRRRGITLTPEERQRRRVAGGFVSKPSNEKCKPGCTCKRHKPPKNTISKPQLGRKNCTKCGRWRLLLDFDARDRDLEGNALAWQAHCKSCQRIRQRIWKGIKQRGEPYQARPERRRLSQEEYLVRRRERYREKMKDPAWRERWREYHRIYSEVRRRRAGAQPREAMFRKRNAGHRRYDPQLPIEPFQKWIKERAAFYARKEGLDLRLVREGDVAGISSLADRCGLAERTLRRFLDGKETVKGGEERALTHVSLGTVDEALTNEGTTFLWELYSDDEIYDLDELRHELVAA